MVTLRVKAEEEFAKNAELKQQDLDELRDWMSLEPHLPVITDEQLILFLHSCYYDVSRTKDCIEVYYKLRMDTPEVFNDRALELPDTESILSVLNYVELPVRDDNGYHIIYHSLRDPQPSKYVFPVALKVFFMLIDSCIVYNGTCPGIVFLLDARGVRLGHIMQLSISLVRKGFKYLQEGMPIRLKAIHILSSAFALDQLIIFLKPFMKQELYNMIHFHKGTNETIYDFIPKRCLPQEYGGDLPTVAELHDKSIAQLKFLDDYFKEEEKQRTVRTATSEECEHVSSSQ